MNDICDSIQAEYKEGDVQFYGLTMDNGKLKVALPEFLSITKDGSTPMDIELDQDIKRNILSYLDLFRLTDSRQQTPGPADYVSEGESNVLLDSYIWVLTDYLSRGVPLRQDLIIGLNAGGRIEWKKTIQKQPIVHIDGQYILPYLVTSRKRPIEDRLIQAYQYCVNRASEVIGWLYSVHNPVFEEEVIPDMEVAHMISAVKNELASTFADMRKQRLLHMNNILLKSGTNPIVRSIRFGSSSFHPIFEKIVLGVFGTVDGSLSRYYPYVEVALKSEDDPETLDTLRPDCIMETKESIIVIDAKYYRYGKTKSKRDLPQSQDVVKQFPYAEYIEKEGLSRGKPIYNLFILPNKSDVPFEYVSNYKPSWRYFNKTFDTIHMVLADLNYLIGTLNSNMRKEAQSKLIGLLKDKGIIPPSDSILQ